MAQVANVKVRVVIENVRLCEWSQVASKPAALTADKGSAATSVLQLTTRVYYSNDSVKPLILPLIADAEIQLQGSTGGVLTQHHAGPRVDDDERDLAGRGVDLSAPGHPFFEVIKVGEEGKWGLPFEVGLPVGASDQALPELLQMGKRFRFKIVTDHRLPEELRLTLAARWSGVGDLVPGKVESEYVEATVPTEVDVAGCGGIKFRD